MNPVPLIAVTVLCLLVAAAVAITLLRWRHRGRRGASRRRLMLLADQLEADLKACRSGLEQAHAVMSINPDRPDASAQEARHAVDTGLRALLSQRIWIRDDSPTASQQALDEAVATMSAARARLHPLLGRLDGARDALNDAMREHIRRESGV